MFKITLVKRWVPAHNSYILCLNYPVILFIIGIASYIARKLASYIAIVSYIAISRQHFCRKTQFKVASWLYTFLATSLQICL